MIFLASTMFSGFVNDLDYGAPREVPNGRSGKFRKNITSTGRHRAFSLADPGREKCALDPFEMWTACRLVLALGRDFGRLPNRTPNFAQIISCVHAPIRQKYALKFPLSAV